MASIIHHWSFLISHHATISSGSSNATTPALLSRHRVSTTARWAVSTALPAKPLDPRPPTEILNALRSSRNRYRQELSDAIDASDTQEASRIRHLLADTEASLVQAERAVQAGFGRFEAIGGAPKSSR